MSINEELKIILHELYYHFEKHRISYDRLYDRIKALGTMDENRIASALDGLCNDGHVKPYSAINSMEYQITASGESLLIEDKRESAHSISIVNNGSLINSPIGNHSSGDFLFECSNAPSTEQNKTINNTKPIEKPDGWSKKFPIFWNSPIGKILINVIGGALVAFIGYYFTKSREQIKSPTPTNNSKLNRDSVKKH